MTLSDIIVIYLGKYDIYCPSNYYHEQPTPHAADVNSKFKIVRDLKYAYYHNERLPLRPIVTNETYYIDDIVVDERTWNDVFKIISDNIQAITGEVPRQLITMESDDTAIWSFSTDDLKGKCTDCAYIDGNMYVKIGDHLCDVASIYSKNIKKENDDMIKVIEKVDATDSIVTFSNGNSYKPVKFYFEGNSFTPINNLTITNYKYNPETRTTTLYWSDNSQTSVTADPDTEANEFTGFCAACAKKLFGNKSTYLNQFDKWTVKIPARQKAEVEKKAAENKLNAESKAKRDAKKAKRKKQREIEKLAKQIADEYYAQELTEEAEKLAIEKYGVPKSYLDDYDCDCDNCNCKEFDVMDDDNITD